MQPEAQGIAPILDLCTVEPIDAFRGEESIVLPEAYADDAHRTGGDMIRESNKLCFGIVRAVGPGWKLNPGEDDDGTEPHRVPVDLAVGMQVMYDRASASELPGTDPMLVSVPALGILLVVEGDAEPVFGGLVSARG
jgi:hypothetical protein